MLILVCVRLLHDKLLVAQIIKINSAFLGQRELRADTEAEIISLYQHFMLTATQFISKNYAKIKLALICFFHYIKAHIGIHVLKARKQIREQIGFHHRRNAKMDLPLFFLLKALHILLCFFNVMHYFFCMKKECLPLGRQGNMLLPSVYERQLQFIFQGLYRLGNRWL